MTLNACTACGENGADYAGLPTCAACAGARALTVEEAQAWIASERSRLRLSALNLIGDRSEAAIGPIIANLEGLVVQPSGMGFSMDFAALAALDALTTLIEEPIPSSRAAPNAKTGFAASLALYDLGQLQMVEHQVRQFEVDILEGIDGNLLPRRTALRGGFPFVRKDRLWTRWTQVAYNRGPDLAEEATLHDALLRDDPQASMAALARSLTAPGQTSLDIMPIVNSIDRQMFKAYAPRITFSLAKMDKGEILRLQSTLDAFSYYAEDSVGPNGRDILTVPRGELLRRLHGYSDASMVARLTANSQGKKLLPLAWKHKMKISFPAQLSRQLRRMVLNYRQDLHGDRAISDLASDIFERIISRTLRNCGYETIHQGKELVSIATKKGGAHEIDVFAWNDNEVLLIEAKFEIDPPGGWTPDMIAKRAGPDELGKHVTQHAPKAAAWDTHLRKDGPTARFHPGDELIQLPQGLLKTRRVRLLIVSGRIEPNVSYPVEVVTFLPPLAAAVARSKLPSGQFSRIWDGTHAP